MTLSQQDSNQQAAQPDDPNQGIVQAIIINSIIAAALIAVYFLVLRRFMRLYSKDRKKYQEEHTTTIQPAAGSQEQKTITNPISSCLNIMFKKKIEVPVHGQEAYTFMLFQKRVIIALSIMTVLGLVVLLPVNLTTPQNVMTGFSRTTVAAAAAEPARLWAHLIMEWVFVGIILAILAVFYMETRDFIFPIPQRSAFTVLMRFLPRKFLDARTLHSVWNELLPDQPVDSFIALDVRKGFKYRKEYDKWEAKHHHALAQLNKKGKRPKKLLIGKCTRVDAIDYTGGKMNAARDQLLQWHSRPAEEIESSGYANIVFRTQNQAEAAIINEKELAPQISERLAGASDAFQPSMARPKKGTLQSLFSKLDFQHGIEPADMQWKNIGATEKERYIRKIISNVVLIIVLVFLSTPPALVSTLQEILALPAVRDAWNVSAGAVQGWTGIFGSLLFKYLPTILQLVAAAILIAIVVGFTRFELFSSYSRENRELMRRVYTYLILGTLVLPSLALVALDGVINWLKFSDPLDILRNMFIPSGGVFFIIYLLNFLFISVTLRATNLVALLLYAFRRYTAISDREKRKSFQFAKFGFPIEYAITISVFGIVIAYSVLSPIILPIGWLLFVYKYYADKHNLLKVYDLSDNENRLAFNARTHHARQKSIVMLTIANLIIMEIFMMAYFIRSGELWALFVLSLILFIATLGLLIAIPIVDAVRTRRENRRLAFESTPVDIFQYYTREQIAQGYSTPSVVPEEHGLMDANMQQQQMLAPSSALSTSAAAAAQPAIAATA